VSDTQQYGDARTRLRSLSDGISAAAFFDPQHRSTLDRLRYGNEGARQKLRCALSAMSDSYIEQCCRDIARVFARDGLAEYLAAEGVPFEGFDDFHDVARALGE